MTSLKASANRPSRAESLRRKEENENGFQWPLKNGIGNANLEEGGGGGDPRSAKTQITVPVARSLASSGFTILLRLLLLLRMNFIVKRI